MSTCIASQQDVQLPDYRSLLAQSKRSHVGHVTHNYVYYYITEPQMWELIQIVIPKIKAEWESLAYCMRYTTHQVHGFKKDSHDSAECCINLLSNWIVTDHGPKPKTYQTLLKHIRKIRGLTAASEAVEKQLIDGKHVINNLLDTTVTKL